ncbi:MAG: bifunctional phosphopantothenoylcysteine decarboxylase/phosphopantothenate--cysteine ligase CoaBC [Armatimonadetes bacterium]|nr:bifunctional phosphopantothenoylcysteine decarboxylase/phosphopantothenate--cysteine ligase CoaBC [Armatimonadota bacterium]
MTELADKTILVGVSGGIAAYKAADLVSKLVQAGARVRVILTRHAAEFVTPVTFQALSGSPVYTETFAAPETYGMGHLSLADGADALVVAPATANLLAKAAGGLADDLLSTTLLSVTCPVLLAPAMNPAMWHQPATERNVAQLRADGRHFVGPDSGWLACRDTGEGRMASVPDILWALRRLVYAPRDLVGRRILITAGPTREHLDPVRFISNPSTGKQGYALAEAAILRGAEVTLVTGPTSLTPPAGCEVVQVVSARDMAREVLSRCAAMDVIIGVAAVGDFTPATPSTEKLPKIAHLSLALDPTQDIIAVVAASRRPTQVVVGFAAETHDVLENAQAKRQRKGLDLIVANDVSEAGAGFGGDGNRVVLLDDEGAMPLEPGAKLSVGQSVLDWVVRRLG